MFHVEHFCALSEPVRDKPNQSSCAVKDGIAFAQVQELFWAARLEF